jgi:uncharacterized protein involved in exopolysaccharide biosynthesis
MESATGSSSGRIHWRRLILIPALFATLAGFFFSYAFPAKYTSQSLILVEGQKVPESMVQPVVSEDLTARVATLQQQVLSQSRLQPVVGRLFPNKNPEEVGEMIDMIRASMTVEPVMTDMSQIGGAKKEPGAESPVPGFYVSYTAPSAREAQQICNELTTLMVDENLKSIQSAASGTSDVLNRGIEQARNNLIEIGGKLESLKKQRPDSEALQKVLTIDYDSAQKTYEDLLAKKSAADLTILMNNQSEGERMFPLNPANLPDAPWFPNRLLFAGVGLSIGLVFGIILALRRKFTGANFWFSKISVR